MIKIRYKKPPTCPYCKVEHIEYSECEGDIKHPKNGDICICSKCAGVAEYKIFKGELQLIRADEGRVFKDFEPDQLKMIINIRQQILSKNDPRQLSN